MMEKPEAKRKNMNHPISKRGSASPRSTCPTDFRHSYGSEKTDMPLVTAIAKKIIFCSQEETGSQKIRSHKLFCRESNQNK